MRFRVIIHPLQRCYKADDIRNMDLEICAINIDFVMKLIIAYEKCMAGRLENVVHRQLNL